ncbi:MAG: hypothetical protein ACRC49_06635, partial [Plesiomonas sp.]
MSVIAYGRDWSLNRLAAVALAILILMPLAFTRPLLEINLFGVDITASVWEVFGKWHGRVFLLQLRWCCFVPLLPRCCLPEGYSTCGLPDGLAAHYAPA